MIFYNRQIHNSYMNILQLKGSFTIEQTWIVIFIDTLVVLTPIDQRSWYPKQCPEQRSSSHT